MVKPGYKQSEVGVIPEDWEVKRLGEIADRLTGYPFPSTSFVESGIRLLKGSNVKRSEIDWTQAITSYWASSSGFSKYLLRTGDLVVAMDGALVGSSFATLREADLPSLLVQRVMRIRTLDLEQSFLCCSVQCDRFTEHCNSRRTHTAIPHISPEDIAGFLIPLPPTLHEQNLIATALSDTDNLIETLEKLIEKKKQIKQGAMQTLLTGKIRLPGFSGDWVEKRLGEVGDTYGGLSGKSKDDFQHGSEPYVPFLAVINAVCLKLVDLPTVYVDGTEKQNLVLCSDLLFNGSSETPEEVGLCSYVRSVPPRCFLNSFCIGFRLSKNSKVDGLFLAYLFRSNVGRCLFRILAQGATRYNLSKESLKNIITILPPTFKEQEAIASVLTSVDDEIEWLEARLAKTKSLKQGMMQQLLTGKIRLI